LKDSDVREIRLNPGGETQDALAARYKVAQPVVSGIVLGKTRRHVA